MPECQPWGRGTNYLLLRGLFRRRLVFGLLCDYNAPLVGRHLDRVPSGVLFIGTVQYLPILLNENL